jgi:outer membrane beta-barrel protein
MTITLSSVRTTFTRSLTAGLLTAAATIGLAAAPKTAHAQEIQLTGPLAGAPAVRDLRQYRKGRFEVAPVVAFTLLDEYQRTTLVGGRLQYNFTDWFALGVWGAFGLSGSTDLTDQINANAPRNTRTATNVTTGNFADQTAKLKWMVTPQVEFTPFRGKLALFNSIFVDTDAYLHAGMALTGIQERGDCGDTGQVSCTALSSFALQSRVAVAPSFGIGLNFYLTNFVSLGAEYRAFPFSWNRAGFDTRGSGSDQNFPDNKVNADDRTFKFNQMVAISLGFSFPTTPKISP